MIKVSVLYPHTEGARFDMEYYRSRHMPMVREKLGAACKGTGIEQGVSGAPGSPPPFVAIGHILFESMEAAGAALGAHAATFMADIPNYTPIQPIIQISEVKE